MLADHVLYQRSESGCIRLYDDRDEFSASFRHGIWHDSLMFELEELEEFSLIDDEKEIEEVLEVARAALNCPAKF